jgi:hypothetical protein
MFFLFFLFFGFFLFFVFFVFFGFLLFFVVFLGVGLNSGASTIIVAFVYEIIDLSHNIMT